MYLCTRDTFTCQTYFCRVSQSNLSYNDIGSHPDGQRMYHRFCTKPHHRGRHAMLLKSTALTDLYWYMYSLTKTEIERERGGGGERERERERERESKREII